MATQNVRILPYINQSVRITDVFWSDRGGYYHKGVDLSIGGNPPLYSMCDGVIIGAYQDGSPSSPASYFGNYVIIKDSTTGLGFLYAHMNSLSVRTGDNVLIGQQVGTQGRTGDSTGVHLHLEMQDLSNRNWIYNGSRNDYINPAEWIGYTEIIGDYLYYNGIPIPFDKYGERDFPWVVLWRKNLKNNR